MRGIRAVAVVTLAAGVLTAGSGCGRGEEPAAGPSVLPTVTVSAEPSTKSPRPEPELPLTTSSVVIVRELASGARRLVAYEFATGYTHRLVRLSYDENPAVSPDGTQVVVERANGPGRDEGSKRWLAKSGSHLVLIDLVTGEERSLTATEPHTWASDPQWNRADRHVYYLRRKGLHAPVLMRVDPGAVHREPVPHGRGVVGFVLEPDGVHALVTTAWCTDGRSTTDTCGVPHEWRLELATGYARLHRVQAFEALLSWTADGRWLAATQIGPERSELYVTDAPESWRQASNLLFDADYDLPSSITHFTAVGWQPGASQVVLGSRTGHMQRLSPTFDRWYVSLIDRRTGKATVITPGGAADTSFDVWWPEH